MEGIGLEACMGDLLPSLSTVICTRQKYTHQVAGYSNIRHYTRSKYSTITLSNSSCISLIISAKVGLFSGLYLQHFFIREYLTKEKNKMYDLAFAIGRVVIMSFHFLEFNVNIFLLSKQDIELKL